MAARGLQRRLLLLSDLLLDIWIASLLNLFLVSRNRKIPLSLLLQVRIGIIQLRYALSKKAPVMNFDQFQLEREGFV